MREIAIDARRKLRAVDKLNWQLWELRENRDGEAKWQPGRRYYQTLGAALSDLYEQGLRDGEDVADLKAALAEARRIARSLARAGAVPEGGGR